MRGTVGIFCGTTFVVVALACLTGCEEARRVGGDEFRREFELRNAQTMVSSEFLGEKDGKVFLRKRTMSLLSKEKWNEEILFTEKSNLDKAFLAELARARILTDGGGGGRTP